MEGQSGLEEEEGTVEVTKVNTAEKNAVPQDGLFGFSFPALRHAIHRFFVKKASAPCTLEFRMKFSFNNALLLLLCIDGAVVYSQGVGSNPLHDVPVLTIDLRSIDTNAYAWKYHYVNTVPVSGIEGYRLLASDVDHNGFKEVYGLYQDAQHLSGQTRIYEFDSTLQWQLRYIFPERIGVVENIEDVERNGLVDIQSHNADSIYIFKQPSTDSLPTQPNFRFRRSVDGGFGIPIVIADITADGKKEIIYRGSERDSAGHSVQRLYIAQYDSFLNNYDIVWSRQLPPGCEDVYCSSNMAIGDFANDGRMGIVTSSFRGNVFMIQKVADSIQFKLD